MSEDKKKKAIIAAFDLLLDNEVYCAVPGWFNIRTHEDLLSYVFDRDTFYEARIPGYARG